MRSPIRRPALPRASSAMSGFFFCGSIDEPVAYASASRMKPNSSVDHSTISSPRRERCTWVSAATNSASATKSRSETASSEFSNGRAKSSAVATDAGIERQARTRERARAERRHVGAVEAVVPAVDVAGERPEVREQMVREQHRLGALEVRVARAARSRSTPPRVAAARAAARGSAPRPRGPRAAGRGACRARPGRCGCGRCAAWRRPRPRSR